MHGEAGIRVGPMTSDRPAISGVLETSLYVDDLHRAHQFYERTLGLKCICQDHRFCAFAAGERSVLLLFRRGSARTPVQLPHGFIPSHDGKGAIHIAFAVRAEDFDEWEARVTAEGVAIAGSADWPNGGRSLYFRDPDGHLVELATPGLWPVY